MDTEIQLSVYFIVDYKRRKCTPRILPFSIFIEYVCLCTLSSQQLSLIALISHMWLEMKSLSDVTRKTRYLYSKTISYAINNANCQI